MDDRGAAAVFLECIRTAAAFAAGQRCHSATTGILADTARRQRRLAATAIITAQARKRTRATTACVRLAGGDAVDATVTAALRGVLRARCVVAVHAVQDGRDTADGDGLAVHHHGVVRGPGIAQREGTYDGAVGVLAAAIDQACDVLHEFDQARRPGYDHAAGFVVVQHGKTWVGHAQARQRTLDLRGGRALQRNGRALRLVGARHTQHGAVVVPRKAEGGGHAIEKTLRCFIEVARHAALDLRRYPRHDVLAGAEVSQDILHVFAVGHVFKFLRLPGDHRRSGTSG